MPLKMCKGCKLLMDKSQLYRNLCRSCKALAEAERGSRRQRGIGPTHEQAARLFKAERASCECPSLADCGYFGHKNADGPCGNRGTADNPIQVGHRIPRSSPEWDHPLQADAWDNLRPECRGCNLSRGNR